MKIKYFELLAVENENEISKICKQIIANELQLKGLSEVLANQEKVIRNLSKDLEDEKRNNKEAIAAEIESNKTDFKVEINELRNVQTKCITFERDIIE